MMENMLSPHIMPNTTRNTSIANFRKSDGFMRAQRVMSHKDMAKQIAIIVDAIQAGRQSIAMAMKFPVRATS